MAHRNYILAETVISGVLSGIIGALFVFVMFGGRKTVGLWGDTGLAFDLLPTVFMITLMSTIALTLLTRKRVKSGKIGRLDSSHSLPGNVIVRALLLAMGAVIALVPVSVGALALIWDSTGDWAFASVLLFKVIYSVLLGLVVTPIIVRSALSDDPANKAA